MGGSLKTNVTWAITKQEKLIYDGIFRRGINCAKRVYDGEATIGIFGKVRLEAVGTLNLSGIWQMETIRES